MDVHCYSGRALGRDPLEEGGCTDPDDKGLGLHWYAIDMYTGSRVEEAH